MYVGNLKEKPEGCSKMFCGGHASAMIVCSVSGGKHIMAADDDGMSDF